MEPKLTNLTAKPEFPPEPQFHDETKEKVEIPRIVPAELQNIPPTPDAEKGISINPSEEKKLEIPPKRSETDVSRLSKDLGELSKPLEKKSEEASEEKKLDASVKRSEIDLSQLSKDLDELSKPLEKKPEEAKESQKPTEPITASAEEVPMAVPADETATPLPQEEPIEQSKAEEPPKKAGSSEKIVPSDDIESLLGETEDDYSDEMEEPEDTGSSHPIFKTILLLVFLVAIIIGALQVCLFLQPDIMKSAALSGFSQLSCQYLYCPPLRPLRVVDDELDEIGNGKWMLALRIENRDIRPQEIPRIHLTVDGVSKGVLDKTYGPADYTVIPYGKTIESGTTSKFEIPFDFTEGQPTKFTVQILKSDETPK